MDSLSGRQIRNAEQRILIYGASDAGEMALRWILINPNLRYKPIGFIDNDQFKVGRKIHGVEVLGGFDKLESIIDRKRIDGMIVAGLDRQEIPTYNQHSNADLVIKSVAEIDYSPDSSSKGGADVNQLIQACSKHGCWVKKLRLEFEAVD
jgi:FlaA1/EpsC-like NDP-sugar epimerase